MIEDRRAAPPDTVGQRQLGRQVNSLEIEGAIQSPPESIEYIGEIAHRRAGIQSARQRRVEMMMQIDETGRNQAGTCIDATRIRVLTFELRPWADGGYPFARPDNGSIGNDAPTRDMLLTV
jgi:hypothetical protein